MMIHYIIKDWSFSSHHSDFTSFAISSAHHIFSPIGLTIFFHEYFSVSGKYVIFVLIFFHSLKTKKNKPIEPIRNLFSFSTDKYSWKKIGKPNWWKHVVSQSCMYVLRKVIKRKIAFAKFSTSSIYLCIVTGTLHCALQCKWLWSFHSQMTVA